VRCGLFYIVIMDHAMWKAQLDSHDKDVYKVRLSENNDLLCFEDVIYHWHDNHEFRSFYISILKESPFDAFFWEHPPLTESNTGQAYEFVLVNSPQLSGVNADPEPFSRQFNSQAHNQSVIRFENLGGDAELVVPRPMATEKIYSHFAIFLRNAPQEQAHQLFVILADAVKNKIGYEPIWISTSGLGVYWLHIRLDKQPKYYTYEPYKATS
jgi:uncharacterized protein DUF6940